MVIHMKKTHKNMTMGISLGMCFGVFIGCSLGQTIFGNMSIGISLGIGVGMCVGMAIGSVKDAEINDQLQSQAYTIKNILPQESDDGYIVLIVNKNGDETFINVTVGEMETEEFCVGDFVFLDEDGRIEQALDKDDE